MSHSFTFNFERLSRAPARLPQNLLAVSFFFFLALAVLLELALRAAGLSPSVDNTPLLWAAQRMRVSAADAQTLVLIGTSRIQNGFSVKGWQQVYPSDRILQLAQRGSSPLPVLEDLAADTSFHGRVLCDTNFFMLVPESFLPQANLVDAFHNRHWPWAYPLARLWAAFQDQFVIANPDRAGETLLKRWRRDEEEMALRIRMFADRTYYLDFSGLHPSERKPGKIFSLEEIQKYLPPHLRDDGIARIKKAVETISARGGKVVFTEFVNHQETAGKEYFWDALAAKGGAPSLYWGDYPELSDFKTPDRTHLDGKDTFEYTRRLAGILKNKGWL